jgi:hypothetical protein
MCSWFMCRASPWVQGLAFNGSEQSDKEFVAFAAFLRSLCNDTKLLLNSRASASFKVGLMRAEVVSTLFAPLTRPIARERTRAAPRCRHLHHPLPFAGASVCHVSLLRWEMRQDNKRLEDMFNKGTYVHFDDDKAFARYIRTTHTW